MDDIDYNLTKEDKLLLLSLARESIEEWLQKRKFGKFKIENETLKMPGAAFVTLTKGGRLRGCIGQLKATMPLYECVREMALAAAARDPRFSPLTVAELKEIEIEISCLTPLQKVADPEEIEVGRDGLLIKKGYFEGVLLPQVALSCGWSREEFLSHTCLKANLPVTAWKEGAEIFKFQAIIFSSKDTAQKEVTI